MLRLSLAAACVDYPRRRKIVLIWLPLLGWMPPQADWKWMRNIQVNYSTWSKEQRGWKWDELVLLGFVSRTHTPTHFAFTSPHFHQKPRSCTRVNISVSTRSWTGLYDVDVSLFLSNTFSLCLQFYVVEVCLRHDEKLPSSLRGKKCRCRKLFVFLLILYFWTKRRTV